MAMNKKRVPGTHKLSPSFVDVSLWHSKLMWVPTAYSIALVCRSGVWQINVNTATLFY